MARDSILKAKSFQFAIEIVRICQRLREEKEFVLSRQLLRSGTSVGAQVREAEFAESRSDFQHKLSIGLKEINETVYWLALLFETGYLTKELYTRINLLALELVRILAACIKTIKSKK